MKILVVTPYFFPKIGGLETYAFEFSKKLIEKFGYEIVVITSNHTSNTRIVEEIQNIKIYRLPFIFKFSNTPINPFWLRQIKSIIKKEKPQVINAHSPVPFIADIAFLAKGGIPFILTYHSGSLKKEKSFLNPLLEFYEELILRRLFELSDEIIVMTPHFIKQKFPFLLNKIEIIPPGITLNPYRNSIPIANRIIYLGRIEKNAAWKGISYLITAVSIVKNSIPDICLHLVGEGDQVEEFETLVKKLDLRDNVYFTGTKKGDYLMKELAESQLLVLPSVTDSEALGLVLLESMASRRPVIGSNIGGIPYVIDNGIDGYLAEPKNSNELAKLIVNTLQHPDLWKKLGNNAFEKVKKDYSWDIQIEKFNRVIKRAINNKNDETKNINTA